MFLTLKQTSDQLVGTAVPRVRDANSKTGPSKLTGNINRGSVAFTISWTFATNPRMPIGVYTGTIDEQGNIQGTTSDQKDPRSRATWHGNRAAKCKVAAVETPPAVPPVALGKVKVPSTTSGPPVSICDLARDARKRGSPAAPGLEAKCRVSQAVQEAGEASTDVIAALTQADLTVRGLKGPGSLQAGLSGTFTVTIMNMGDASAKVELAIVFAGKLDQTGQVVAGAGLACEVVHDKGINAALRCTGGRLGAGETATIVVQGRGQEAGTGMLVATLNNSRSVAESNYDNNLKQLNLAIQ